MNYNRKLRVVVRVVTIVSIQRGVSLPTKLSKRRAQRAGANDFFKVSVRKKVVVVCFFFQENCRKINCFPCSFCLANTSGKVVLSTVVTNTIMQIVCSYRKSLY